METVKKTLKPTLDEGNYYKKDIRVPTNLYSLLNERGDNLYFMAREEPSVNSSFSGKAGFRNGHHISQPRSIHPADINARYPPSMINYHPLQASPETKYLYTSQPNLVYEAETLYPNQNYNSIETPVLFGSANSTNDSLLMPNGQFDPATWDNTRRFIQGGSILAYLDAAAAEDSIRLLTTKKYLYSEQQQPNEERVGSLLTSSRNSALITTNITNGQNNSNRTGPKLACSACIRGHRAPSCKHYDRTRYVVRPRGRPSSLCQRCLEKSCDCVCLEGQGYEYYKTGIRHPIKRAISSNNNNTIRRYQEQISPEYILNSLTEQKHLNPAFLRTE